MFKRIANLLRGFLGLFISGLERNNPEALLEREKEHLRSQIAEYNSGLISQASLCERLKSQTSRQSKELAELKAKAAAHLKAGNRKLAGEYALRAQNLQHDLDENTTMLNEAETTYSELKRSMDLAVTSAREKIESLGRSINETKIAKATAELNEMAAGLITQIGGTGDNLNRLEQAINEEKEKAKGKARVAKDAMDLTDLKEMENERAAMEELALAKLMADAGIIAEEPMEENSEMKELERHM